MDTLAIQFDRPWWLAALVVAAIPLWLHRRKGRSRGVGQALALALVAAALAYPSWHPDGRRGSEVAVFVDVSASQGGLPEQVDLQLPPSWHMRARIFADGVGEPGDDLNDGATLLGPVLSLLATEPDPPAAAVIVTDGRFTDADLPNDLPARIADGSTALLLLPRETDRADARVADLAASVQPDGRVRLAVTVVANAACRQVLRVSRADRTEPLAVRSLDLSAGEPVTVRLSDTLGDGAALYAAELTEPDLLAPNNRLVLPVRRGEPTLLWVAGKGSIAPVAPPGWRLRRIAPATMPTRADDVLGYAAIVVVDVDGRGLSADQRKSVADYVHLGGGLVLIGSGPYGSTDDLADPINRIAPLVVSGQAQRPLDVTVLLDASASMAEPARTGAHARKFDLAAQAVMAMARQQLTPGDHLRVITFTSMATERFDEPATEENLDTLAGILANVRPVGGTRVAGALRMAWEAPGAGARDRLVVVLSDLQTEAFDPSRWAKRFSETGISLAVTAVGAPDPAAPLAQLALRTGGRFELRADLTGLADVFIRTLQQVRGDPLIRRVDLVRVHPPLFDTGLDALPRIDTYLAAAAHPDAEVLAATRRDAPLLARRRAGAGRVVGLTVPLEAPYNSHWRTDPAVADLLAAAVRWTQMPAGAPGFDGTFTRSADGGVVTLEASGDGGPMNHLALEVTWADRDGTVHAAAMTQIGPGRYWAGIPVAIGDPVVLRVRRTDDKRVVWSEPQAGGYPSEYSGTGVDADALADLAARTGGRVIGADDLPQRLAELRARHRVDLWPWLLAAALCVTLVDWISWGRR